MRKGGRGEKEEGKGTKKEGDVHPYFFLY